MRNRISSRGLGAARLAPAAWPGQIAAQRFDHAGPVLARLGDPDQGPPRALVAGLGIDDGGPGGGGGGQIRHPLLFELRDAQQQLHTLGDVGRPIGAGVQQLGQIGPGLGLGQHLLERAVGLFVVADLGQDQLGDAAGILRAEQTGGGDAQHPAQEPEPLLGVGRGGEARLIKRRQRAPLVRLAGQSL